MVNTEDFIKRLETLLDYYGLNASLFADKIGVQRSSISHLLSGRNKPSLDFILKIMDVFPDVDLYWMLNGKGNFLKAMIGNKSNNEIEISLLPPTPILEKKAEDHLFSEIENIEIEKPSTLKSATEPKSISALTDGDDIEKIVIFYSNGKFVAYNSK